MAVNLSALAGAGQQFFDNNGNPLSGGKLWSYQAGTTTPQTTYTTAFGNVAHTNPIILDSAGRVATGQIWLTAGQNYKFVLKTSTEVTIATWDNITGINGTGIATNANNVEYDPPFTGAVTSGYTVQDKLAQTVSVKDFGAVGDGVVNDTAAFVNALATGFDVFAPSGTYLITLPLNVTQQRLYGQNGNKTTFKFNHTTGGFAIVVLTNERGGGIDNFAIDAVVDGLKGINMLGTVIAKCEQIFINNFTSVSLQLGNTATPAGIYWSKIGLVRIRLDSDKDGDTGVLIDGQTIPGSNDNSLEDVVIGGNFKRPLHIKGIGNSVKNGTIELTRGTTNVVSMIYIEGGGNRVQDMYIEPVGTPPAILVEFGPNSSGNTVEVWPQYFPTYNVSASIIDNGVHNKVKLRRVGGNFKIGPEAEPSSNLLINSAFKVWRDAENPRGWLFGTAGRISRVAPTLAGEPTTLQMTVSANSATIQGYLTDYFTAISGSTPYDLEYLRGKPVIAGVWCKTSTAGLGNIKLSSLGFASSGTDTHSGSGNYELLLAHGNIAEAATRVWIELRSDVNNAAKTGTVDFRDPFFMLGSDVFYFTPKPVSDTGSQMFGDLEFPLDYSDKALGGMMRLNGYYLWVDTTGDLRIGATRPTNATWDSAGVVVGTQT